MGKSRETDGIFIFIWRVCALCRRKRRNLKVDCLLRFKSLHKGLHCPSERSAVERPYHGTLDTNFQLRMLNRSRIEHVSPKSGLGRADP